MKTKIKPYHLRLLKDNFIYLLTLILLFGLFLILSINILPKLANNREEINKISLEINQLKEKLNFINNQITNIEELNESIKFINALIPSEEDYFSIIYALEKLSQKTGFIITSYIVNLKDSNTNKIQLTITGIGDKETFMKFLKEYNFAGGRLITSDKIELSPDFSQSSIQSGGIKINIAFYNKNVSKEKTNPTYDIKFFSEIKKLKDKIEFSLKESSTSQESEFNYPRKTNPF